MIGIQEGVKMLEEGGYLEVREGRVRLGGRGLLEFRGQLGRLAETGGGDSVKKCAICLEPVLAGKRCPQCSCFIHSHCYAELGAGGGGAVCPQCRGDEGFGDFGY